MLVDGKQRLTAVRGFFNGEVSVFGGNYFQDFDEQSRHDLTIGTNAYTRMTMHLHGLQYRRELLDLYLQLNEGAIAHAPEELDRVRALRDAVTIRGEPR